MTVFIPTGLAPRLDLHVLRRDYFDGFSLLLQDADGLPINLTNVTVCASVWKRTGDGSFSQVLNINAERQEPLSQGRARFWLTSAQTALLWDEYGIINAASSVFFPNAYTTVGASVSSSPLVWDVRIETEEELADLVSVSAGAFVTQINHTLGSSERVIFRNTAQSSINYNGTSARIYSGLTNISYQPPYSFTVPSLSAITDAALGGSVYRLRQDTVVAGNVFVGSTVSNCFP
jgi:hypothetical protein